MLLLSRTSALNLNQMLPRQNFKEIWRICINITQVYGIRIGNHIKLCVIGEMMA